MKTYTFKTFIRPGEDGYFVASVPSFPGCYSQGKTMEEALVNIKEAIVAYLEVCLMQQEIVVSDDEKIIEASVKVPPELLRISEQSKCPQVTPNETACCFWKRIC